MRHLRQDVVRDDQDQSHQDVDRHQVVNDMDRHPKERRQIFRHHLVLDVHHQVVDQDEVVVQQNQDELNQDVDQS